MMLHRIFVVMTRATEQFVMVKLCWGWGNYYYFYMMLT